MAYNFDPELAEIIPRLPVGTFDDPATARVFMMDVVSVMCLGRSGEG
jgi:hypothetical protein